MTAPLSGIRVVEVGMWAFVPSAGAVLRDWGAEVVKIEHPDGDPIRYLAMGAIKPDDNGVSYMWELFNRGKRSVSIDLSRPESRDILMRLIDTADVFLVSLLPPARRKLGIDVDAVRARNPRVIYAAGTGQGPVGDESEKGGYDSISFWARSGIASSVTPDDYPSPLTMPTGAFGDSISGALLAGGIAAAIAHRERTGEGSAVDGSLLATGMWSMQAGIVGAHLLGALDMPKFSRDRVATPLVNTYRTMDERWVSLCMLEGDTYWPIFCRAIDHDELANDPRFATNAARATNIKVCVALLEDIFITRPLDEWKEILGRQPGQWDVIKKPGELIDDRQAVTNGFVQRVDYGNGVQLPMIAAPVQFDRTPATLGPAPPLGADTDDVLRGLGMDEEELDAARDAGLIA